MVSHDDEDGTVAVPKSVEAQKTAVFNSVVEKDTDSV